MASSANGVGYVSLEYSEKAVEIYCKSNEFEDITLIIILLFIISLL